MWSVRLSYQKSNSRVWYLSNMGLAFLLLHLNSLVFITSKDYKSLSQVTEKTMWIDFWIFCSKFCVVYIDREMRPKWKTTIRWGTSHKTQPAKSHHNKSSIYICNSQISNFLTDIRFIKMKSNSFLYASNAFDFFTLMLYIAYAIQCHILPSLLK